MTSAALSMTSAALSMTLSRRALRRRLCSASSTHRAGQRSSVRTTGWRKRRPLRRPRPRAPRARAASSPSTSGCWRAARGAARCTLTPTLTPTLTLTPTPTLTLTLTLTLTVTLTLTLTLTLTPTPTPILTLTLTLGAAGRTRHPAALRAALRRLAQPCAPASRGEHRPAAHKAARRTPAAASLNELPNSFR